MARHFSILAFATAALARYTPANLYLNFCSEDAAPFQTYALSPNKTRILVVSPGPAYCLDVAGAAAPGSTVRAWPCGADGRGEDWAVGAATIASALAPDLCVSAAPGAVFNGTPVVTGSCAGAGAAFALDAASGRITHTPSGLCVDNGAPVRSPPFCSLAPQSAWPFCDATLGLDARAADIVARLSLADKINATVSGSPHLGSVGMPAYQWWNEATHGVGGPGVSFDATLPGATNTALPITTSCSFNRSLWKRTGNMIGREGRAFINNGSAGLTFWTPVSLAHTPAQTRALKLSPQNARPNSHP